MSSFSDDLSKFEKYFNIEVELSEISFGPIFKLISKIDDSTYGYHLSRVDIQDYPNDRGPASRVISELKSIVRNYKIDEIVDK